MNKIDLNASKHAEQTRMNRSQDTGRATPLEQESQASPNTENKQDKVSVSERAETIERLTARATELPDVRQEKVEAMRERLQSGSYNPSANDIAGAILKDEK